MSIPIRRSLRGLALAAAVATALCLGGRTIHLLAAEPGSGSPPKAGPRRCVGLTSQRLSPSVIRVYRIFEDGSLEACDDGAGSQGDWVRIGK